MRGRWRKRIRHSGMDQPLNFWSGTPIFDIFVVLRMSNSFSSFFIVVLIFFFVLLFGVARLGREDPRTEIFKFPF
jgi:hypothetical protein